MNSPRTTVVSLLARALAGPALAPVMLAQAVAPSPAGSASASGTTMAQEVIELSPFTVNTDLRDSYPFGLFASPMRDIVRLHASSGTTGKPIVVAYTREDVAVWTSAMARCFAACGVHEGDVVQNAYGYGLFTGGLGAHYGAEGLGATVIPISGGRHGCCRSCRPCCFCWCSWPGPCCGRSTRHSPTLR